MNFTKLAQANVDFYNNHPAAHKTILVGYAAFAVVVLNKGLKRIAGVDTRP